MAESVGFEKKLEDFYAEVTEYAEFAEKTERGRVTASVIPIRRPDPSFLR